MPGPNNGDAPTAPTSPATAAFLAHLDESLRPDAESWVELPAALDRLIDAGRDAWPTISVDDATFAAVLAERVSGAKPLAEELGKLRVTDLYIACACARGDDVAVSAFEKHFLATVGPALGRMRVSADTADEVKQLVRNRVLVATAERPPRIADYAGRGDLRGWVRATAVRTCLNLMRKHKRELIPDDDRVMAALPSDDDDPELAHIKRTYREQVKVAFGEAIAQLADREQNVLRHYYVDELTIDQIGAIYRVHRVTAFRWLTRARDRVADKTRRILRQRLRVTQDELDSIVRLIHSQLDLSLATRLGAAK